QSARENAPVGNPLSRYLWRKVELPTASRTESRRRVGGGSSAHRGLGKARSKAGAAARVRTKPGNVESTLSRRKARRRTSTPDRRPGHDLTVTSLIAA